MKQQNKKTEETENYEYLSSVSSHDCTGLIPAAPADGSETQSYEELYPFLPKAVIPKDCAEASPEE